MITMHCRRRWCGTRLVDRIDGIGRVVLGCPPCARNAEGLCRDCPRRLDSPGAMRCDRCATARTRRLELDTQRRRRADETTREQILANRRRWYRENPESRARVLKANLAYRRSHPEPSNVFTRKYKREQMRQRRKDRSFVITTAQRRREVAELKRRGLWPAVKSLPPNEIPRPRRNNDAVALAARDRRAKKRNDFTTVDVTVTRPGRGTAVICRTTMLRSA